MGVQVFDVKQQFKLKSGETGHWWWNHAKPPNAVWSANAIPLGTGSTGSGFNQDTQLEVTRVWRRLKVKEKGPGPFADTDIETEIHYTVKNLGNKEALFTVYLCAASPFPMQPN